MAKLKPCPQAGGKNDGWLGATVTLTPAFAAERSESHTLRYRVTWYYANTDRYRIECLDVAGRYGTAARDQMNLWTGKL